MARRRNGRGLKYLLHLKGDLSIYSSSTQKHTQLLVSISPSLCYLKMITTINLISVYHLSLWMSIADRDTDGERMKKRRPQRDDWDSEIMQKPAIRHLAYTIIRYRGIWIYSRQIHNISVVITAHTYSVMTSDSGRKIRKIMKDFFVLSCAPFKTTRKITLQNPVPLKARPLRSSISNVSAANQ